MAKYLSRETVVYRFKWWILPDMTQEKTEENLKLAWGLYLIELWKKNKISKHQSTTWKYPKKELNL